MRIALPLLTLTIVACGSVPSSSVAPAATQQPGPQPAPSWSPTPGPTAKASPSWVLWPSSASQVEVLGTWVDGRWVGGRDSPPTPSASHPLVALSGEASGALSGASRTVCDQLLLQYQGPFVGNEVVLLSPAPAHPRPVRTVDATASDRSLAAQLWPGHAELDPGLVLIADLNGDGTNERIVELADFADDDEETVLVSGVAVSAKGGSSTFTGWPLPTERPDLEAAGVPASAHRVELAGVADVNGDGALEVVAIHHLDDLHYHGLVIYSFTDGQLLPIGDFSWGERDCYPPDTWSEASAADG